MSSQGFRLEPARGGGTDLVVTGEWTPAARRAIEDGRADGLVLNYAKGFRGESIDFIRDLPIRKLDLLARWIDDLGPIHSIGSSLRELRIQSHPKALIDISTLPHLEILAISWKQVKASIHHGLNIEDLAVPSYSETNLEPLLALPSLRSVTMKQYPRPTSLKGLESMSPQFTQLRILGGSRLSDITALEGAPLPEFTALHLEACRKITDISSVAHQPSLKFFDLADGGVVRSLAPIEALSGLEGLSMYGTTNIADGDLSPVTTLPKLMDFRLRSRRHYKPPTREIEIWVDDRRQRAGLDRLFTPAP